MSEQLGPWFPWVAGSRIRVGDCVYRLVTVGGPFDNRPVGPSGVFDLVVTHVEGPDRDLPFVLPSVLVDEVTDA